MSSHGFVTVYGTLGLLASQLLSQVKQAVPVVSIGVGIALALLGATMLRGYEPKLAFLKVGAVDRGKGLRSLYVFGLSYAVVSLSCGFAGFSGVVVSTLRDGSVFGAAATYLTFSAGMGLVLMVLTLAAALAQQTVSRTMKRALPYVNRVSGLFLVIAGAYVAYYGYWSYRIQNDTPIAGGPVLWVERWSASISSQLLDLSTATIVTAIVVVAAVIGAAIAFSRRKPVTDLTSTPKEQP